MSLSAENRALVERVRTSLEPIPFGPGRAGLVQVQMNEHFLNRLLDAARDEGAGTMGRGEALVAAGQAMVDDYQTSPNHHPDHVLVPLSAFDAMRAALAAPVSAPRFVYSNVERGDMDYWIAEFGFNRKEDAEAFRRAASTGQRGSEPADGSQVEPSTAGYVPTNNSSGDA